MRAGVIEKRRLLSYYSSRNEAEGDDNRKEQGPEICDNSRCGCPSGAEL